MKRTVLTAAICAIVAATSMEASANPAMMMQQQLSSARTAPASPPQEPPPITGKVVQTLESGGYSYILLKKEDGQKVWLAVPQGKIVVGEQMTFRGGMEMSGFESKSLNRTFDRIIFSEGPVAPAKGGKESKETRKSPGSKGAAAKADEKISVEKASGPNGYRVAELYKLKGKLDKKKVNVRGKVIKVSSNIMGKNWIHLQDGSGSSKKGNNNLVVTSQTVPLVGEVVTASGILYKDKDFGGGYKYEIIMEKAEISIE